MTVRKTLLLSVALVPLALVSARSATAVDAAPVPGARAACATALPGHVRCFALLADQPATSLAGERDAQHHAGYGPPELQDAYRLPSSRRNVDTIAIVDAYDDPSAEADLAVYRAAYGLSPCTTSNGCLRKLNQDGEGGHYPRADDGWAVEISLDLDVASAACPQCKLVLVEARTSAVANMAAAVDAAVGSGAGVVSNSYGVDEYNGMQRVFAHYQHVGHTMVVATGDFGFRTASFPAVVPGVVAVGGTSLYRADNGRGWTEHTWRHAGSGCSAYVTKPRYQHDPSCRMRTVADVAAVADPKTGVAVYDSATSDPSIPPPGWIVVGGTSAAAPLIAATIALAGNATTFGPARLYRHADDLFDVVGGSNGFCGEDYLCTARPGYDGPTGLGTPDGVGAF